MAEKKIIWKQKTGADSYDILYPRTLAENVTYGSGTVKNALDNIGTNLENKFVTLDTDQIIYGSKTFREELKLEGISASFAPKLSFSEERSDREVTLGLDGFYVSDSDGERTITFPNKSGRLLVDGDIPRIGILPKGSGNAITDITASGHVLTVTKGTFATTATATQSANGLMSSTDKSRLDSMWKLWTADGTDDKLVNKVEEALKVLENLSEGADINALLESKADATELANYVTLDTEQTINGAKTFSAAITCTAKNTSADTIAKYYGDRITYIRGGEDYNLSFPSKSGTFALVSDITWGNLAGKPSSLPPSGNAGGDLTGTYPNPTIGAGKVTEAKIGSGAVTESKIGSNAVTTGKIKDGNVTNAKLDSTGVTAGSYSIVTVNAQGRATAGSQLFTIGTASVIPSTVMTSAFYLQEVA